MRVLFAQDLPGARIVFDADHAKSKVACGLLRYLEKPGVVEPSSPDDYTNWPIGLFNPATRQLEAIVPPWSPVRDCTRWYAVPDATIGEICDANFRVELHRGNGIPASSHGYFSLLEMPSGDAHDERTVHARERIAEDSLGGRAGEREGGAAWIDVLKVTRLVETCDELACGRFVGELLAARRGEGRPVLCCWLRHVDSLTVGAGGLTGIAAKHLTSWLAALRNSPTHSGGHRCEVRFLGAVDRMELRIVEDDLCFGNWVFHRADG